LTYQWYHAGTALTGQNGTTLTINNVTETDHGPYYLTVTNACGSATSYSADCTVYTEGDPPAADPGCCFVPDVWRKSPVPWVRDVAPQNNIDDLIDAAPNGPH